jgi:hypothetical protein
VPGQLSAIEIHKDKPQGIISYFAPNVGDHHLPIFLGSFSVDCEKNQPYHANPSQCIQLVASTDGKNFRKGEYHIGPQENCDAKIFLSKCSLKDKPAEQ